MYFLLWKRCHENLPYAYVVQWTTTDDYVLAFLLWNALNPYSLCRVITSRAGCGGQEY